MSLETEHLLNAWRESAGYWNKHRQIIGVMFAPITRALIAEAGIAAGQSVIDIAGGTGEPSLTIAEVVGPAGRVTYTDAVSEMVETARSESERRGLHNMSFHQCSGDSLPFENDSFDVVTCRLGVMLFAQPFIALSEMLRVTKPGGRIALAVWHTSEMNPFFSSITNVMARHIESPPADPSAPGAFRFAEPGSLATALKDAGTSDVRERILSFRIEAPLSIEEFWPLRVDLSDTLREKVSALSPEQLAVVASEAQRAAAEFFNQSGMSFPASAIIVQGRKP